MAGVLLDHIKGEVGCIVCDGNDGEEICCDEPLRTRFYVVYGGDLSRFEFMSMQLMHHGVSTTFLHPDQGIVSRPGQQHNRPPYS